MTSNNVRNAETFAARLESDEQSAHKVANFFTEELGLADVAVSLVDAGDGSWRVALYFQRQPDEKAVRALTEAAAGAAAAAALTFERLAATDWVGESLAALRPVEAGRFVVHGAHNREGIAPNRIAIEIEAGLAFGTGHHGTTRGCLLALDRICKASRARRIIDLGTGSGVLAIAAARALREKVLAIDIDANAVRVARANARFNRVGPMIEIVVRNGVAGLRGRGRFDLILANILLRPLQRLAAPLITMTAPGGRVVLSGLLASQANAALAAYRGLVLERRIDLDGWTTLVLIRRAVARRRRRS